MADAGEIWFRALSNFGQNVGSGVADAMKVYHDRQEKIRTADATMLELSQTVNPSTGKPVIDPKAYEEYLNHSDKQRALLFGAKIGAQKVLEQYGKAAYATAHAAAQESRATIAQRAVDTPLQELNGQLIANYPNTGPHILKAPGSGSQAELNERKEARIAAHQQAGLALKRRNEIASIMQNEAQMTPDQFMSQKFVPGVLGDKGFVPQAGGTDFGLPSQGKEGTTYTPFAGTDFQRYAQMADEYKKLGQTAFGGLTGGKQSAPVMVQTPDEARKLPPGTVYQAPNGKVYQVPAQ